MAGNHDAWLGWLEETDEELSITSRTARQASIPRPLAMSFSPLDEKGLPKCWKISPCSHHFGRGQSGSAFSEPGVIERFESYFSHIEPP